MAKQRRETLDESTVVIDGKKKSIREYLDETQGRDDGREFGKESARYVRALSRTRYRDRQKMKDKVVYTRHLTPGEIAREEVKLMAAQAEKALKFLIGHPKEWFTSREICTKIKENPKTAGPTVSRVVKFFELNEPDLLRTKQVGRAREMMFMATADDVDAWSQEYNQKYLVWLREYVK